MEKTILISTTIEMAQVCAELEKQNVVFNAKRYDDNSWIITITGH